MRLIDAAALLTDAEARRPLYLEVQELVARDLPYVSLFTRANVAVLARDLFGYRNYLGGELLAVREMSWRRDAREARAPR